MKIGVFISSHFWSSIPYDGLNLFKHLSNEFDVDLLALQDDIRLNKKFNGNEKFFFDKSKFTSEKKLKDLKDWNDFFLASNDYDIILTNSKIANKIDLRSIHKDLKNRVKCPIGVWDIGGSDILTDPIEFANFYFTKGSIWTEWLQKILNANQGIFTTGSPHYDYYLHSNKIEYTFDLSREEFCKKYNTTEDSSLILVAPSNPSSHTKQYDENLPKLEKLCNFAEKSQSKIKILVKTYPHDYIFHEKSGTHSGIYHRKRYSSPQYEALKENFPIIEIIESQDHFSAMKHCDKLFNISGSHLAWETVLTDIISFTSNYSDKPYYQTVKYLPDYVKYPDEIVNIEIQDVSEMFAYIPDRKQKLENFISRDFSFLQIENKLKELKIDLL
jgi:hypothetical protein